ncbi:MAG: glycosyltransferase [Coriobacteriia bacterium]|nr:glycosyltransferase [Coriobacteriia bacterium]
MGSSHQSEQPLISVIIPVYNTEKYLAATLDSVLCQTLTNIEVICVNDGSADNSLAILKDYANKDSRIVIIDQENQGAGAARNAGLKKVTGKYCLFVDSDDFLGPSALETVYKTAENNTVDVVIFGLNAFNENTGDFAPMDYAIVVDKLPVNQAIDPSKVPNFYKYVVGFTVCKAYNVEYLRSTQLQFPGIGAHEDMPFTYVACSKTNRAFILPEVLYHYRRQREGSLSDSTNEQYLFMLQALECFKNDLVSTNCWAENSRNYYNYVLHMVKWKFDTLPPKLRASFADDLRTEWYDRLGITPQENYFYIKEEEALFSWTRDHSYLEELIGENKRLRSSLKKQKTKNKKLKEQLEKTESSKNQSSWLKRIFK